MELSTIVPWVEANFQLGDVRRSRALGQMAYGLASSDTVSFASIGRAMSLVADTATAASQITRVHRFCHNKAIDPRRVQSALVSTLVGSKVTDPSNPRWVAVAMDWHTFNNGAMTSLRTSLITGSRAIPLFWYEARSCELKARMAAIQERAIRDLIDHRTPGMKWLVLLDSGFASSPLIPLLEQAGGYIIRPHANQLIHANDHCWTPIRALPVGLNEVVEFGWVHWTVKVHAPVRLVIARLLPGRKPQKGRRSSNKHFRRTVPGLCPLVTNLTEAEFAELEIVRFYGRRFEIEHSFRDIKNASYGKDMEHVNLDDASTYRRLMCIVALAMAIQWLVGAVAESRLLQREYTPSRPRSGRRVLSLATLGQLTLMRMKTGPVDELISTHLEPATRRALTSVSVDWRDTSTRLELTDRSVSKADLKPLSKSCCRKYQGRATWERCTPSADWSLTDNQRAPIAADPREPKAA